MYYIRIDSRQGHGMRECLSTCESDPDKCYLLFLLFLYLPLVIITIAPFPNSPFLWLFCEMIFLFFCNVCSASWSEAFPVRNLQAFSAEPLLLYPTHYTFEAGYISDTEKSTIVQKEKQKQLHQQQEQSSGNCSIKDEL